MEPEIILPRRGQDLRVDLAGANILERGDEASRVIVISSAFQTWFIYHIVYS